MGLRNFFSFLLFYRLLIYGVTHLRHISEEKCADRHGGRTFECGAVLGCA